MAQETLDGCKVDVPRAEFAVCAPPARRSSRSINGFMTVAIAANTGATGILGSWVSLSSTFCHAATAGVSENSAWGPNSDCINSDRINRINRESSSTTALRVDMECSVK